MVYLDKIRKYGEWNPFITKANGKVTKGEQLEVCISPPDGKKMTFKPTVKSAFENCEFSWLGRFLLPGIFDECHIFTITKNDEGCLFLQKEEFSGMLVPLVWGSVEKKTRTGFELMNNALKERAESENI